MRYEVVFHRAFIKVESNRIVVGLTSKPERGKADTKLVKKIAKYFDVPKSHAKIIAGLKSRRKIVEVTE